MYTEKSRVEELEENPLGREEGIILNDAEMGEWEARKREREKIAHAKGKKKLSFSLFLKLNTDCPVYVDPIPKYSVYRFVRMSYFLTITLTDVVQEEAFRHLLIGIMSLAY